METDATAAIAAVSPPGQPGTNGPAWYEGVAGWVTSQGRTVRDRIVNLPVTRLYVTGDVWTSGGIAPGNAVFDGTIGSGHSQAVHS